MEAIASKNPVKVRAGQIGSRVRWGPPRHASLTSISPAMRDIILALIAAAKETPASEISSPETGKTGSTSNADRQSSA